MKHHFILLLLITVASTATITVIQHCSATTEITIPVPALTLHPHTV